MWRSLLVACLLAMAGCLGDDGGSDDGPDGDGDQAGGSGDTGTDAPVHSLSFAQRDAGEVLVDDAGWTLYIFTNDVPGESRCEGGCLANWPPLLDSEVPSAPATIQDRLSLIERPDGDMQVALDGAPLYYFAGDQEVGDTNGDGVGGVWFVVRPPPPNSDMLSGQGPHAVTSENVTYHDGTTGYHATAADARVGIVVIHEWWGLNDHIRDMADQLASHGFAVLAVDLFDGQVAQDPAAARAQVEAMDQDEAVENMRAAADHLRDAGASDIVSLGWCFGGGQSLQLALSGEALAGTVIYYGDLVNDSAELAAIDWPVLGIFGEEDQVISVDEVRAFETALDDNGIENQVFIYPDVGHAFANPSAASWAPEPTQDAWLRTMAFLDDV